MFYSSAWAKKKLAKGLIGQLLNVCSHSRVVVMTVDVSLEQNCFCSWRDS